METKVNATGAMGIVGRTDASGCHNFATKPTPWRSVEQDIQVEPPGNSLCFRLSRLPLCVNEGSGKRQEMRRGEGGAA